MVKIDIEALIEGKLDPNYPCDNNCEVCDEELLEIDYGTHLEYLCPKNGRVIIVG